MEIIEAKSISIRLQELEDVISTNLQSFYEVGKALIKIRDDRLYLHKNGGQFKTFETYCQQVWDMGRDYARKLITASEVRDNLNTKVFIPETHLRPLTRIKDPEKQREIYQKAIETAPEGKITGVHVENVVREITGLSPTKRMGSSDALKLATNAISQLKKIRNDDPEREKALNQVLSWIKNQKMVQYNLIPESTDCEILEPDDKNESYQNHMAA